MLKPASPNFESARDQPLDIFLRLPRMPAPPSDPSRSPLIFTKRPDSESMKPTSETYARSNSAPRNAPISKVPRDMAHPLPLTSRVNSNRASPPDLKV